MVTKFAHLSDCFSLILDRVPLKDLMCRASLVSHHWRTMQLVACRRRRSLVLLFGMEPIKEYKEAKFKSAFYRHGLDEDGAEFNVERSIELNRLDVDWQFRLDEARQLRKILPNIRSFTLRGGLCGVGHCNHSTCSTALSLASQFDFTQHHLPVQEARC